MTLPAKKLVVDLGATAGAPKKIEGIALVDRRTIAIVNANGQLVDSGIQTQLLYVRLPKAL